VCRSSKRADNRGGGTFGNAVDVRRGVRRIVGYIDGDRRRIGGYPRPIRGVRVKTFVAVVPLFAAVELRS